MKDPTDNVSRLEIIAKTMEAGHWHSSAKVMRDAADEIEQMRKDWKVFALSAQLCIDRLTAERDEARRMVCEKEETLGCDERGVPRNGSARDHAKQRGWDCFKEDKEDTDD